MNFFSSFPFYSSLFKAHLSFLNSLVLLSQFILSHIVSLQMVFILSWVIMFVVCVILCHFMWSHILSPFTWPQYLMLSCLIFTFTFKSTWLALWLSPLQCSGVWWAHTLDWLYVSLSSPPVAGVWWAHTLDWIYVSLSLSTCSWCVASASTWLALLTLSPLHL